MAFTLSLAAGVMTAVSTLELLRPILRGTLVTLMWAVAGVIAYVALRSLVPESPVYSNRRGDDFGDDAKKRARQWRLGILMMATLTAHNLPEVRLIS